MKTDKIKNLVLGAMFIAIGVLLPFFTGQIPQVGSMLLPMHIPVLLCGLICGGPTGFAVGLITPILRSLLFGMPPIYPDAAAMAFELAAYGAVIGYLYSHAKWHCIYSLYKCMLGAMLCGRVVWGIAEVVLLGIGGTPFTFEMFIAGAFINAIPGIILQLILVPSVMVTLGKTGIVPFGRCFKKKDKTKKTEEVF